MDQVVNKLASDLAKVRTGRASVSVFDGVMVDYYGQQTPLNQVAGLANPEPSMLTIQPWEANMIPEIEKAIMAANLGFTPSNDGNIIRVSVPPLTEERRKEYAKQANSLGETAKTAVRGVRRDVNDAIKKIEKDKEISQDDMHRGLDEVQKITDKECDKIDKLVEDKEKEILTV
jgi:ribosome recycling factor